MHHNAAMHGTKPAARSAAEQSTFMPQDPDRCGILPFVFDEDFGFERYAEYALDVPMYFVNR